MTEHIHKRHNVNLLIYHLVCPDGNLKMIENYIKNQGIPAYTQLHNEQLSLFDGITIQ